MARFERWLEVKRIFETALEVEPEERAAFLDRTCGQDQELRAEVEALLGAPAVPTAALAGLLGFPDRRDEPDYAEGDRVHHFTIVREVGKGGMGTVYEARDARNNDRRVAVKVLFSMAVKLSQDKRLAGLSHPAIVTFHDSGETEEGLPYFVFEFIEGEPITGYCERRALDVPQRLRLFQKVCEAVAYAHQRLVIHCDLKPENILVTAAGDVKLLDFGIAKEVGAAGSAAGEPSPMTLPFASPEQVAEEETTTLSDVYSLGVLFSVLLAGRLPYQHAHSVAGLRDAILRERPSPPSELVLLDESLASAVGEDIARYCTPPPAKSAAALAKRLRGDLDAIVLCCLRKDPKERYGSVHMLTDDIRRHLECRPVSVRPATIAYRTAKLLRRRALPIALASAAVLALVIFSGVIFIEWREASRQRDQARTASAQANTVTSFLLNVFAFYDPEIRPGNAVTVKELLDNATKGLPEQLRDQPETQVKILNTLAQIYIDLDLKDRTEQVLHSALQIAQKRLPPNNLLKAESLTWLAVLRRDQTRYGEANGLLDEARRIQEPQVPATDPGFTFTLFEMGDVKEYETKYKEAEALYRKSLELRRKATPVDLASIASSLNALGELLDRQHRNDEGLPLLEECLRLRQQLYGLHHPLVATTMMNIAVPLADMNRVAEAEHFQRAAIDGFTAAFGESNNRTVVARANLGSFLLINGRLEQGVAELRRALAGAKTVLGENHPDTIMMEVQLARGLMRIDRFEEAHGLLQDAAARAETKSDFPKEFYATIVRAQGQLAFREGAFGEAERSLRRAVGLLLANGQEKTSHIVLATGSELGDTLVRLKRYSEAEPLLVAFQTHAGAGEQKKALASLLRLYVEWGKTDKAEQIRKLSLRNDAATASPSPR